MAWGCSACRENRISEIANRLNQVEPVEMLHMAPCLTLVVG